MNETTTPPVEDVLSEVVIDLAFAAHAYLEPSTEGAARQTLIERKLK